MHKGDKMLSVTENDLKVVDLYRDFLPEKVFDAHMHIYGEGTVPSLYSESSPIYYRPSVTIEDYFKDTEAFYPGVKQRRVNALPMPDKQISTDPERYKKMMNAHLEKCLKDDNSNVGGAFILPTDDSDSIRKLTENEKIRSLKCYCYSVYKKDPDDTEIEEFLPESAFEVSSEKGIPIILHMMKKGSLSDEKNFSFITSVAKKYPRSKLVLAHCARSFAPHTVLKNISMLSEFDNIWFDTSAINEPVSIMSCVKFNKKRVLYGTDYPVAMYRGRAFSFGDSFLWLTGDLIPKGTPHSYILTEGLLALYESALLLDLDQTDIEDIFYNNAAELFLKRD